MNEELESIFQQYKTVNPNITEEMFNTTYEKYGDEYISVVENELKKKDQPIENGNQDLTTSTPPQTDLPTLPNPIPENEFTVPLGSEQDLMSAYSDTTVQTPSMDLPLTDVVSSGTESLPTNQNIQGVAQQPTYTKPSVGAMAYPIGNEEIGQYNERVAQRNRTITAQNPLETITKTAVIKQQELINTLKQPEFTLTPEAEKNLDEILKISDDEIKESEDFIKKFTYGEYDEKPIVTKQPFDSWGVTTDDKNDDNLLALESRGLIQIDRDVDGSPVFEDNKYRYKIIDKNFYDNDYSTYIDNLQREETKKWEEANVDKARTDLTEAKDRFAKGESTPDATPLQDRYNEYYRKTGDLFSQDNIERINTEEGFAQLLAEGIAKKNVSENPSLDYNQEYEKALKTESPYSDEQLTLAGINLIGEIARGVSLTKDSHKTMLESTNRDFTDADDLDGELAFFQKVQQNPEYARQFAKYWYMGGGRDAFGASETRLKATFNSQEGRSELMDSFEAFRNVQSAANYEANKEIFNKTREEVKKARERKDINAIVSGVDKLQTIQENIKKDKDYFESFGTMSDERKSVQKIVQKKQLEQQQNEADYKNALFGTAKGNVAAIVNGVLDAGKDIVLGIPRLLNNVTSQSDAVNFYMDEIGKPTQVFNVKTSSMLEKVTTYDLNGRQIEERNGFLFEKKNDKLSAVTLTAEQRSNLVKKDSRTDFSGKGFFGTVANQIVTMAGAEFIGGKVLSLLAKARYGKSIAAATQVFGAESAQVRNLISKQKLLANPSNNGVVGWTVATLENNYQDAVGRGLKGWEVVTSMATQSFITGIASKISPDVKFFREAKTLEEGLIQALRNGNAGLAKSLVNQFTNALPKAITREVAPEILQEYSERFGQTAGEIITTVATGKNGVTDFNLEEFRDIGLETAATVATLGLIGHARGQGKTFEFDGKNFDISRLNRQEQLSLLANIYNPQIFKDFKDNFGVTGNKLNEVENRVKEVKKYIDKIPEKEKYSLDSMFKVGVLLQKIELERENLKKDDGTFAERINAKIAAYTAEVNTILDNDLNPSNQNAETPQSTPQPETVQEQTNTTDNEPEQTAVQQPNPIAPIEPSGGTGAESGVEQTVTEQPTQNISPNDETNPTETTTQSDTATVENVQDIPTDVNNETEINEDNIVLPDDFLDLLNNIDNETVQTDNIGTDGNAESSVGSVQQIEQGGQENPQAVSATTDTGASEGNAEVKSLKERFDTTNKLTDTSALKKGDYAAVTHSNGITYQGIVTSVGRQNIKLETESDMYGTSELQFPKSNVSAFYKPTPVQQNPTFSDNEQAQTLNENQSKLSNNVIATSEKIELPDGSEGYVVKITDNNGNPVLDKNEDSEYDFATKEDADKFISQKKRGFNLSNTKKPTVKKENNISTESNAGKKVNFTFLGEPLSGEIQLDEKGKEIIVSPDGTKYSSALAKNVTNSDGTGAIDFQSTEKTFTPIPQSTYDKLVKRLLGVFKKFGGKVITDWDSFVQKSKDNNISLQNIESMRSTKFWFKDIHSFTYKIPTEILWEAREFDRMNGDNIWGDNYIQELTEDIKKNGILNPILIVKTKNGIMVTEGNHRLAIARELGIKELPVAYSNGSATTEQYENKGAYIGNLDRFSEVGFLDNREVGKVDYMHNPNGEIYGAKFPDGTIYLNPEKVNANTPIHEFSHLWQQLMPSRFKKGVEILKNTPIGKTTFAELKANEGYANKSDDELWNEALVTVMGNEGERIFNSSRASKFKEWLTDLFKALGNAFGIRDLSPNDKLSTFVKGALSEVMGTKEIIPESNVEQKEVPIYIKKMSNVDLRNMLDRLGLVMDAVCP